MRFLCNLEFEIRRNEDCSSRVLDLEKQFDIRSGERLSSWCFIQVFFEFVTKEVLVEALSAKNALEDGVHEACVAYVLQSYNA